MRAVLEISDPMARPRHMPPIIIAADAKIDLSMIVYQTAAHVIPWLHQCG